MASLLFEEQTTGWMQLRRFRFRRGLRRADRVIAVSDATRRDVENLSASAGTGSPVYNAPDPGFCDALPAEAPEEQQRILERYQIHYPFLLYAGTSARRRISRGWWRHSPWCATSSPPIRSIRTCG